MKKLLPVLLLLASGGMVWLAARSYEGWGPSMKVTHCKENLETLAAAIDKYALEHYGLLPDRLETLTPDYLRKIPLCESRQPESTEPTYVYEHPGKTRYVLFCNGHRHADYPLPPEYPQYLSGKGLVVDQPKP